MRILAKCAMVAFLLCATAAGAKDLTLRERTSVGAKTHETKQYWTHNKMIRDDPQSRTITDFGAKTITTLDKAKKTYSTITFDELRQQIEAMHQQLAHMPPEVQKLMGQTGGGSAVTAKPTGKTQKIAGYDAKEYAIEGGPTTGSVWMTEALDTGVATSEWKQLAGSMSFGAGQSGGGIAEAIAGLKGVQLRRVTTTTMGDQSLSAITEVLEVYEKAPPADVLTVPHGFKQIGTPSHTH